jgi:hypothetical protein
MIINLGNDPSILFIRVPLWSFLGSTSNSLLYIFVTFWALGFSPLSQQRRAVENVPSHSIFKLKKKL